MNLMLAALFVVPPLYAEDLVIYESKWEQPGPPGPEWNTKEVVEICPNGARVFLAKIRDLGGGAELTLEALPPHRMLRVEYDLILQGSWDGSSGGQGPDRAIMKLDGRRTLLDATFDITGKEERVQTYPFGTGTPHRVAPFLGCVEKGTLGYWFLSGDTRYPADAVYRIRMTVPHEGERVNLFWTTNAPTDQTEAQWLGVDRLRITVLTEEAEIGDEEWGELERSLPGDDPLAAHAAFWRMMEAPRRVGAYLGGGARLEAALVEELLGDLLADEFKTRKAAAEKLMRLSRGALPSLKAALLVHDEPEAVELLREIIEVIEGGEVGTPGRYWQERMRELLDDDAARSVE
jgi:hypothetical protein